jgi:hypothetical protein
MRRLIEIALSTVLCVLLAAPASWAALPAGERLVASLSHHRVALGETLELALRAAGDPSIAPDLSPLERDFEVLGTNQIAHTTISNGKREQYREWRIRLRPRSEGMLTIPPIELPGVANSASAPLQVEVLGPAGRPGSTRPGAQPAPARSPEVFVSAEVDREEPYVQGQVLLTVRILSDQPVLSGQLGEPQIAGASVQRAGDERSYEDTIEGRRFRVIEREYAIFPQKSGALQIPPIAFEGHVHDPSARRGRARSRFPSRFGGNVFERLEEMMGDGFFGPRGRAVRAQTQALVLGVQPRPDEATGRWWLPAEHLKLTETWDREPETLEVGEQVTREVVIQAFGVSRDQIPELDVPDVDGFKQYSEPANDQTVLTEDGLASIKVQKTVVIPTEPGDYVMPAIELAWWDTEQDRARVAALPERRIRVVQADAELAGPVAPAAPRGTPGASDESLTVPDASVPASTTEAEAVSGSRRTPWIAVGALFAAALLLLAMRALRARGARRAGDVPSDRAVATLRSAERALKQACARNDVEAAADAIRDLAAALRPDAPAASPGAVADHFGDASLRSAVDSLQQQRFAAGRGAPWDGQVLWNAYERVRRPARRRSDEPLEVLPPLYPVSETPAR